MTTTNSVVANAIKAQAVRNSVEVEISPGYAARVQHAMRDAARAVSGVRMTSTNTLECRDDDAADDVIDILKQAGLPDGEVWTNAKRAAAKNARLVPFDRDAVKPGDSVWFKGREFEYKGSHGSLLVELEDVFDGEAEFVSPYDRNLKMAANAAYKLSSTEAKVGDRVKVVGALGTYVVTKVDGEWIEIKDADDGTPQGRVEARFATPVRNTCGTARNYSRDTESFAVRKQFETQLERIIQKFISDVSSVGSKAKSEYRRLQKSDPQNAFWVEEVQGWVDSLKEAVDEVW